MADSGFNFGPPVDLLSPDKSAQISFGDVKSPTLSFGATTPPKVEPVAKEQDPEESDDDVPLPVITPLVTLSKVDVATGEEDEECVHQSRCKMYWWGEGNAGLQWKERGVGFLKLLKHNSTKVTRLLMRREQVLKLCANHTLGDEMQLSPMTGSTKAWVYSCYSDFSEPPTIQPATIAIRFKTKEEADVFKVAFEKSRSENLALEAGDNKPDNYLAANTQKEDTSQPPQQDAAVEDLIEKLAAVSTVSATDKPLLKWAAPPASYMTYDNDASHGKPAPSLETLQYVKGDPVALGNGKLTCLSFFAKFAKGDYTTVVGLSELARHFTDVQFVGISLDPAYEDALSFLGKIGTSMPEIYIDNLQVDYPLAWDADKVVKEAYRKVSGLLSLGASATFLVDGTGNIVWREQFGQGHPPAKGQLGEQIRRLGAGEQLLKNGDKAVVEDEEEEDGDVVVDDDYDSDLGF
eukprot:m.164582 g.164582  ORF g.164582 m.164582 type:complete len:463 (-) comp31344_c0_seq1:42-1430(-)